MRSLRLLPVRLLRGRAAAVRRRGRVIAVATVAVACLAGAAHADPALSAPSVPWAVASVAGTWSWPVPSPHTIARPFIAPATPYGPGHRGIDVRADAGTPVRAPADGVIHFAGVVVDRPVISISHAGGVLSSFEPVEPSVVEGDRVERGEVIGVLLAGHCRSPCLHLGARERGEYLNPLVFLGGLEPSVLLPLH